MLNEEIVLRLKGTSVYQKNKDSTARITVNQGGTGSSKTYSLAQLFITLAYQTNGETFSVVRKNMPQLRATAMKDFFSILKDTGIYEEADHNKSDNIYNLNGNEIEFFGLDEPQKVRSRRRHRLWINEGNELSYEAFKQLLLRTEKQVYLDFNPSDEFHWIYTDVLTRPDCNLIISTYKNNKFLPPEVRKEIERYKEVDINYWNIYGLGQVGVSSIRIYTKFEYVDVLPEGEKIMGLDFGYNHATALTEVVLKDDDVYVRQRIHESHLTNDDLIAKMNDLKISKELYIYADSEDPARIKSLKDAGFNVIPAIKDAQSVKNGIDMIKSHKLFITKDSDKGIKELQTYSWKTKDERVLDEPVKLRDDFCDSMRYAVYTYQKKEKFSFGFA